MLYSALKFVLAPFLRQIWVKEVEGLENVPRDGGFIVAANHASHADAFLMVSVLPRKIYFIAGEKYYKSKILKTAMNSLGQIPVDRKAKDKTAVYEAVAKILAEGKGFGIFPEGTRSRSGKLQKAYVGVARFALQSKVDIVPVALVGTYEVLPPYKAWPRFKKIVCIKILEPIRYSDIKDLSPEQITHAILMPRIAKELGQEYHSEAENAAK